MREIWVEVVVNVEVHSGGLCLVDRHGYGSSTESQAQGSGSKVRAPGKDWLTRDEERGTAKNGK